MRAKSRNNKKKIVVIFMAIALLLLAAAITVWFLYYKRNNSSNSAPSVSQPINPDAKTDSVIHVAAMGDMLAHDTIVANAKVGNSYDFGRYFTNIKPAYNDADLVFCNQEGLSSGEKYGISGYPSLNAPIKFAADLKTGAGCNAINLANNHVGDKGVAATNSTIDVWRDLAPLLLSGANKTADEQNQVSYATISDIKVAFVSFADFNNNKSTPGFSVNNYHDEALVRRLVLLARSNADVVIVSMHWGVEDSSVVNDEQTKQANLLSSLGVDVIIGTGPHVLQKVQVLSRSDGGKTVVWYSIGNMLSSQLLLKELIGGVAQFDITKSNNKISIGNLSFTPTYMHYEWTSAQAANENLLARKNAMIYLLDDSAGPLSLSLFNTSVAAQKQYVIDALGSEVIVK